MDIFAGSYVEKFEKNFSNYLGGGYSLTVSNGTTAIELALRALDVGQGMRFYCLISLSLQLSMPL